MVKHKRPRYLHIYKDRHGKERVYFSKPRQPKTALRGPLYSEAFWIDYHNALAGVAAPNAGAGASSTLPGTISALIVDYYQTPAFTSKAVATQRNYKSIIEPFRKAHGDKRVAMLQAKHVDKILGAIAAKSTAQAKNLRKRLSTLMKLAVKHGYRNDNPMLNVDQVQHKSIGYRTWTEADIDQFRTFWKEGTAQRIAFEILLYTGLRRSDAVRIGRQHMQGEFIVLKTKKSGETTELNIPIHDDFRAVLATIRHNHLNLITTVYGAARSENSFTNWIIAAARDAGLPPHSSPHGLRKAACRRLAEAGCSALEIMAITGHKNLKEIETYCVAANKKKLAASAIAKLKEA